MDDEEYDEWELMYGNDLEAENEMNAMEMELSTPTAAPPPKSAPVLAAPSSATVPAVVVVAADEPLEMEVDVEYEPNNLVKEVRDEDRYISRRPSLDTPSIACVLASGERVFIKKKEHEFAFEKAATNKPVQWKLGSSIKTLLESINQRAIEAVVEADRRREENQGGEHAVEAVKESDLWLNKYSPRHFIDLLSDERTNREVLTWLKSWDPVVFPSKSSKAPSKALPDQLKPPNADIRPEHKIINAMEMQAIFGNNRPNCIILDEIDGAMGGPDGKGAISAIQALIAAPYSSRTKPSKQQHAAASNKKAAGGQHPVIRPIICICNDQFAPVLRPLRRLAKIFVMHTPDPRQLMQRMKFICKQENIRASNSLLSTLCDRADNDVRFCLNALQFASARTSAALTVSMIDSMMGRKDVSKGAFDVWDTVFFESKEQQKDKSNACMRVCDTADRFGSHELILHGLHDNLLPLVFNDPTLYDLVLIIFTVGWWMEFADLCDTKVKSHQQFALLAYCSMAAVAVYRACCTSSRRRIEYPKAHYDHRKHVETSQSIMDAFVGSGVALRLGRRVLAVDVVSSVVAMLNPVLTPSQDKQPMDQLIARMASLQLSYKQIQMPGGVVEYLLEPSLDRLVQYKALEPRVRLPLGVRQTMAREVDLENMRRADKGSRLPDDVAAPDVGIVDVDLEDAVAVPGTHVSVAGYYDTG
ncbi:hypothetical protein B5M09_009725 [Aphanomyces astaci]|uniref:ATPase AAA-type core domain-containing protein n=1 Tax=Aphanomyces astaci TaxID=112090 RepID=A0A3R7YF72_APHAT|nr:hypothetical protein B5M09_009725 [Aphanomyces astaci]